MCFWCSNPTIATNLARLGPYMDGIVGTDGEYQDLYAAINTGGWTKMYIAPGATLSQNLTISGANGWIVSHRHDHGMVLNDYKITVTGNYWYFEGIKLYGGAAGWELQGAAYNMDRCCVDGGSSHGLYINSSYGANLIRGCRFIGNGGDGLKISSGSGYNRIDACDLSGNAGYGINTAATNYPIVSGGAIYGNTTDGVNGNITEGNYIQP